jgi:hypothetical protein
MNRRRFLQILAGTAAASTTAYFLSPIGGWKSDLIVHAPELEYTFCGKVVYEDPSVPLGALYSLNRYPYWNTCNG